MIVHALPPVEALAREIAEDPAIKDEVVLERMPESYRSKPIVKSA